MMVPMSEKENFYPGDPSIKKIEKIRVRMLFPKPNPNPLENSKSIKLLYLMVSKLLWHGIY